jgi:hypothetical protein
VDARNWKRHPRREPQGFRLYTANILQMRIRCFAAMVRKSEHFQNFLAIFACWLRISGLCVKGMLVGLQVMGRAFDEETRFSAVQVIEQSRAKILVPESDHVGL